MRKKIIGKAVNITVTVILVLTVGLLVYITAMTMKGKPVMFGGKCIMIVLTGSMEPSLHTGECIIIERTDPETLKKGDIITFISEAGDIYGMRVTHRIIECKGDGTFITRGDANGIEDEKSVRPDQITGKYIGKARFFTWLMSFTDIRKTGLLLVMICTTAIAFYEARTVMSIGRQAHIETQEERHERLMREAIDREIERLKAENYQPGEEDKESEEN